METRIAAGDPAVTAHAITASGLSASDTQKLHRAYEAKQAENARVDDVFMRLNEGGVFDPKNVNERLAVSKAYAAAAKSGDLFGEDASARDTALYLAGTTGIVPDAVLSTLRGAFASDDPARIAAAATLAADLNEASPDALADAGAGTIAGIGTEYSRQTTEGGLSPEQAAGKAMSWLRDAAKAAGSVADLFLPTAANAAVPGADGEPVIPQGRAGTNALGGSPATGQFSPNADDAAPENAGTDAERWLAQARPPRTTRAELMARYPAATLREITQLEAEMSSGLAAISRVQRYNPDWQSPRSLFSTPNGEIRHWRAVRQQAEQDLRDIESNGPTPELVYPNGQIIGYVNRSATPDIRTVSPAEYQHLRQNLLKGARPIQNQRYGGSMFQRPDGFVFGLRQSKKHGETIDIWRREYPGFEQALKVHQQ